MTPTFGMAEGCPGDSFDGAPGERPGGGGAPGGRGGRRGAAGGGDAMGGADAGGDGGGEDTARGGGAADGGGVWMSPAIPTVANLLLAALWGLSVFAGWGLEAFCSAGEEPAACHDRLGASAFTSGAFAAVAALCTAGAWLGPVARRDPSRFAVLMAASVIAWLLAEGVLFAGGVANQYPG